MLFSIYEATHKSMNAASYVFMADVIDSFWSVIEYGNSGNNMKIFVAL